MSPDQGGRPNSYRETQPQPEGNKPGGQPPVDQPAEGDYPRQASQPSQQWHQPPPTSQPSQQWHQPPPTVQPSQQWHQPPPTVQPSQQWHQPPPRNVPPASTEPAQASSPEWTGPPGQQAASSVPPEGVTQEAQQGIPPTAQQAGPPQGPPSPARRGLRPVTVEEIVQADVVTVERDTPIRTVVARMEQQDVGSVVVVEADEPVGILTDRDVALALGSDPDVAERQAGDLLSGSLVTGTTEMSLFEAIRRFEAESIRRLPIVDEEGKLSGVIALDDVLVLLGAELENVTSVIKAQTPRL